jgi:hypothetical protein
MKYRRVFLMIASSAFGMSAAEAAYKTEVNIQRYEFYDTCFFASIAHSSETETRIIVNLKIDHRQNSGQCGCKSALLKAVVFVVETAPSSSGIHHEGLRRVQTTPAFSNRQEVYALTIRKRPSHRAHSYSVRLACDS